MSRSRFAIGYMPHRIWGDILLAQILAREPGKDFYAPKEYVQNDPSTQAYQRLSPMQREVVSYIDSYSDRNLHRRFSKKKTVKDFLDTVDESMIRQHVRPYIEERLYAILEIARDNRIPVFVKDKSDRNIFPEDFLDLEQPPAEPLFGFEYNGGLSYSLKLEIGGTRLSLFQKPVNIVTQHPNAVIIGGSLYFINDIDGKKLLPFIRRERVEIPPEMEEKYFSTFVRNCLRDYTTLTSGFEVRESTPDKRAELVVEEGIGDSPLWILYFHYNRHKIQSGSKVNRFVNYLGKDQAVFFEILPRDRTWEKQVIDSLNELGLKSRDDQTFSLSGDLYDTLSYINENVDNIQDAGVQLKSRFNIDYFLGKVTLEIDSREGEDWFDVKAIVKFGTHEVPFFQLRENIIQGVREYSLPDGSVAILPVEWFKRYRSMLEFGSSHGDRIRIRKQHFSMMDGSVREFHTETLERLERLNAVESIPSPEVPPGLRAELRPYQLEGYTWLCFLQEHGFGGCLADDMGLGKTIQAITLLLRPVTGRNSETGTQSGGQLDLFGKPAASKTSLVVVPASLLHNWISELNRFAPSLRVLGYVGNQRLRDPSRWKEYDVIVSTYHTIRQDIDLAGSFPFHCAILDESQMIKNPASKLYQAMVELRSEHRLVLTGTPIENSLTDLWSQINFVNPGLLGTLGFFKKRFVTPIERKKDEEQEQRLRELINPFILRRTKEQVARELPPVLEQIRYCNMTDDQKRAYEEEKSLARNSILENLEEVGLEQSTMIVLQALTRLRQIANHPAMIEEFRHIDSGKFAEVCRDVESIVSEGHKVLMFSSFVRHLDLYRAEFDRQGISYAYLTGSQNQTQRKEAVRSFQKRKDISLFLISLKAGGVGLNLTAAGYVFILDPWWNPAAELQALNRAHRIGQQKNVFVYRFISGNTIEEKIQRLQARKQALADSFVSSNNPLKDISEKELLELFS